MRIITWNVKRANENSEVWELIQNYNPDIALLQEVVDLPKNKFKNFEIVSKYAINKSGNPQIFKTAILIKGKIIKEINFESENIWVNKALSFFKGNLVAYKIKLTNLQSFNIVSIYSPAWIVDINKINSLNDSNIKLEPNSTPFKKFMFWYNDGSKSKINKIIKLWMTDLIQFILENYITKNNNWIIGGDYNSSETFDKEYKRQHNIYKGFGSSGNKQIREDMYEMGFKECLFEFNKKLVPTFININNKVHVHQLDHLYVSKNIYGNIKNCFVGDKSLIFRNHLSDHLPIIADFKN
ncbi:MAG: hypothetical protein O3A55_03970 [Bacteroidetes bacterium]|nr:hypothetical protein [Bacteroidota bacterium]